MRIIIELDSGASPEISQQPGQVIMSEATSGATDAGSFAGAPGLDQAPASGVLGAAADDASGGSTPAGAAPAIFDDIPMPRFTTAGHSAAGRDRL
jgi:hypothetical protein